MFRSPIECHIRDKLAEEEGGKTEVAAGQGYADIVTDTHVIEVKHVSSIGHAYAAIGQAECYADDLGLGLTPRIHVFGTRKGLARLMGAIQEKCSKRGVALTSEDIPDGAMVSAAQPGRYTILIRASDGMVHANKFAKSFPKPTAWSDLARLASTTQAIAELTGHPTYLDKAALVSPRDPYGQVTWVHWKLIGEIIMAREKRLNRHSLELMLCAAARKMPDTRTLSRIDKDLLDVVNLQWVDDHTLT